MMGLMMGNKDSNQCRSTIVRRITREATSERCIQISRDPRSKAPDFRSRFLVRLPVNALRAAAVQQRLTCLLHVAAASATATGPLPQIALALVRLCNCV